MQSHAPQVRYTSISPTQTKLPTPIPYPPISLAFLSPALARAQKPDAKHTLWNLCCCSPFPSVVVPPRGIFFVYYCSTCSHCLHALLLERNYGLSRISLSRVLFFPFPVLFSSLPLLAFLLSLSLSIFPPLSVADPFPLRLTCYRL